MYREKVGEIIVPSLALAFSLYMILDQYLNDFRSNTQAYTLCLVAPIALCSVISFYKFFQSVRKEKKLSGSYGQEEPSSREAAPSKPAPAYKKVFLLLLLSLFIYFIFSTAGYMISFFILLAALLPLLGVRSVYAIALISIIFPLFIHFVFVKAVGLQLPPGILEGLL